MAKCDLECVSEVPIHPRPGVDPAVKRYGHFDPANREYVITRPDTPQPWYNYITNGTFTGYVSHTGGGTCFAARDAEEKRILRSHLHSRPADQPGRWIYIRDRDSGKFHSATWAPVYTSLRKYKYECRVGTGYTTIAAECDGIASEVTYCVGPDAQAELWAVTITNTGRRSRRLDVFPYAEFFIWSLYRDNNLDAAPKCTDMAVRGRVIVHRSFYDWGEDRGGWKRQFAYFSASAAPAGFDTNLDAFVGVHRGYDKPAAVVAGRCSSFVNRGGWPVAAMHFPITLRGGESRRFVFAVGYAASEAAALKAGRRVAGVGFARQQLAKVKRHWREYLGRFQARTPDPTLDVPFNTFSAYQAGITFTCSRSLAPYLVLGVRGLGYRDSNQDAMGAMPYQPAAATKKLLTTLLSIQHTDGQVCHDFFPGTGVGAGGGLSDDHLWSPLSVAAYVKESGDRKFLDQMVGFHQSKQRASVMDHLELALRYAEANLGAHGLPLLLLADWNDCLNAFPGAESVFTAGLYCAAAKAMESLHSLRDEAAGARRCRRRHATMAERINRHCWDGKWYVRLLTGQGKPIGSKSNRYGKIFVESNTWAVIGQAAPPDRARVAMDSVRKHLCTPFGHRLCWPPYPDYDPAVGTCTIYAPGYKENGAVFCHTNPWVVVAEAMLGRGRRAFDAFARISPYTKDQIQHIHCAEPYAANSMIIAPPNLEAGRAMNPWLTGFAGWLINCMCRSILGVRPEFEGLRIDPCVPRWEKFQMRRVFRGVTYDIRVRNPGRVEYGVKQMTVNGKPVAGNVAPVPRGRGGRKTARVDVLMGQ